MKKEAKVHMLPTEDSSHIGLDFDGNLGYASEDRPVTNLVSKMLKPQHLYITTDEEIKEGEWCIDIVPHGNLVVNIAYQKDKRPYKQLKIIATTDPKLIAEGVKEVHQSFIEEYCKAGGIDKVLVEYEFLDKTRPHPFQTGATITDTFYRLKTDSNNCIIIHPVEEKVYSRGEMLALCKEAFSHGVRLWEEWEEEDHEMWDKFVKENL